MSHSTLVLVAVSVLALTGRYLPAADVTLVENGKSDYVIVVSDKASESEKFAAEELQSHIQKMSGAKLPIVDKAAAPNTKAILLGVDRYPGKESLDLKQMGDDGFALKVLPEGVIAIAGGAKRGTLYGVYTLLERLGVRWWTPTETFLPQLTTIKIAPFTLAQTPRLEYRDMMYAEIFSDEGRLWAARNKVNGMAWDKTPEKLGGRYEFVGNLVHSYMGLLAKSGMEIKQDMLALAGGKRTRSQPCLTNPDTVKAMTAGVIKAFQENPGAKFVVVGQQDNNNYCRCDTCKALAEKEESPSGCVIQFANQVAEAVEKEIPGACITTAAYEWSRKPPKTLRPRDNVFITLCSIECDFGHPLATAKTKVNEDFRADIVGWGKIARKIFIWDYATDFHQYLAPWPNLDVVVPNIKFFADHNMRGVFEQGSHTGGGACFTPIKMWLTAKALWDPNADGKALLNEFVEGYYGPGAGGVMKYIDALHAPVRADANYRLGIGANMDSPHLAPAVIAEAMAARRDAILAFREANVGMDRVDVQHHQDCYRRLNEAAVPLLYVLAKRGPGSATWKAVDARSGGGGTLASVAHGLLHEAEETKINSVAEGQPAKPWLDWLRDYAAIVTEKGVPVPDELKGADPNTYRVIQACMMDSTSTGWQKAEGATDGWALRWASNAWLARHNFSPWDDYTPGKTYQLYVRVKGGQIKKEGKAFNCGVYSGTTRLALNVNTSELADGKWHTLPVGKPAAWTQGGAFYIALDTAAGAMSEVYLDCLWLVETPGAASAPTAK